MPFLFSFREAKNHGKPYQSNQYLSPQDKTWTARRHTDDLVTFIARSTGLNESGVHQVLLELRDAVIFFAREGQSVYVEGLGTYTPTIDLSGKINIGHRAAPKLKNALLAPGTFKGRVVNGENIGKTGEELVNLWDSQNPDDKVSR